jgi:hypothetical protein
VTTVTWVPESCTLPTAERPLRVAEFDALFATVTRPAERLGPMRLRLHLPGGPDALAGARDLVARETGCCSFFSFELRPSGTATELDVGVPGSQVAVLDAVQRRVEAVRAGDRS